VSAQSFTLNSGELTVIAAPLETGGLSVVWSGTSDAREPSLELTPFLAEVVTQHQGGPVVVDFRKLEYMNSGTVSPIIVFVRALDERGIEAKLLFDTGIGWQRVNFVAMKSIARTLKHLSVEG
jgi:hypothetical protein